jgi:dihydroxyacetone kinase-like protein
MAGVEGAPTVREDGFDGALARAWLARMAASVADQRDFLTQLDAAIGDADHGINMDRGFAAAVRDIDDDETAPGALLDHAGRVLVLEIGGAAGPLFGELFRQAGGAIGHAGAVDPEALLSALRCALDGVQGLGAAVEGDKTMVDALAPAVAAFQRGVRAGGGLAEATSVARDAAERGMKATIPMQARKGRASYLGPRSVGHQDPGATSTYLLFEALDRTVREARLP